MVESNYPPFTPTGDPYLDQMLQELYGRLSVAEGISPSGTVTDLTFFQTTPEQEVDLVEMNPIQNVMISASVDAGWPVSYINGGLVYSGRGSPSLGPELHGPILILDVAAEVTEDIVPPPSGSWGDAGSLKPVVIWFGLSFSPSSPGGGVSLATPLAVYSKIGYSVFSQILISTVPQGPAAFSYIPLFQFPDTPPTSLDNSRYVQTGDSGLHIAAGWYADHIFLSDNPLPWVHWPGEVTVTIRYVEVVPETFLELIVNLPDEQFETAFAPAEVAGLPVS